MKEHAWPLSPRSGLDDFMSVHSSLMILVKDYHKKLAYALGSVARN